MSSSSVKSGVWVDRGMPLKCMCGLDVTIYTSKTKENPGRPFFRCLTKRDDHLFKWVEDVVYEEVVDALPKLGLFESEISNAKFVVEELKATIQELKEHVMWSKREIRNCKVMIKSCFVCLCLMVIVIVYLMFGKAKEEKVVLGY